jgi:hypothetical protein
MPEKADQRLMKKVEAALRSHFRDAQIKVGPGFHDNIHVLITWSGFAHKTDRQRQEEVWEAIDASGLTQREKVTISMILPATPEEVAR